VIPSEHFNTVLYTGNGTTSSTTQVITTDIQPDLVWMKCRSNLTSNRIVDAVRGVDVTLYSDTDNGDYANVGSDITAFGSTSFTLTGDGAGTNSNGRTYVAWNWKANGTGVSNTNGSITSTVSANADAGFSIVKWTSPGLSSGQSATIGHGLSKTPDMVIVKRRDSSGNWSIGTTDLGWNNFLYFTTAVKGTSAGAWNNTSPTPTVFTIGSYDHVSSGTQVAYCFHSVDGYSKVGSYSSNNSTDGTFIFLGFRPRYMLMKAIAGLTDNWLIYDSERSTYNVVGHRLWADSSAAESSVTHIDFLSNGAKIRTADGGINYTGDYLYLAFAEHPFKHTNAR
jgi:hypothetical protein